MTLSPAEKERVTHLIVDALGIASAGKQAPGIASMIEALSQLGGGEITPLWTRLPMNAPAAGMALSLLIHGWDFDDTHDEAVVHTASIAVAAAVATAQLDESVSGEQLLDGIVAGVHTLARLARWHGPARGVIRTAGLGAIAAAVTTATTLGLDEQGISSAAGLALTGTLSPTTRQAVVDGSLAKRLQPGLAVQTGITAALLAKHGVQGPQHWLNGDYGILPGSDYTFEQLFEGEFEVNGIALKPYPACRYTHAALAATEAIIGQVDDRSSIERVTAHVPSGDAYVLVARPFEDRGSPIIDAQFSIPWQIASVVVTGRYDLSTLEHLGDGNQEIANFAERIEVLQDLPESIVMSGASVEVVLNNGEVLTGSAEMPGSPERPLSWNQLAQKVNACLAVAGIPEDAETIKRFVESLPTTSATQLRDQLRELGSLANFEEKE